MISGSDALPNDKADLHAFVGKSVKEVSTVSLFEDYRFSMLMHIFPSLSLLVF